MEAIKIEQWILAWQTSNLEANEPQKLVAYPLSAIYDGRGAVKMDDEFDEEGDKEHHYKVVAILSAEACRFLCLLEELTGQGIPIWHIIQEVVDKTRGITTPP